MQLVLAPCWLQGLQLGSLLVHFWPLSACAMKPFIAPLLMSAVEFAAPCGPPLLASAESWKGATQPPLTGSGSHTAAGISLAPGSVPKEWSNERFSSITT